jgi:hypothetical protein
MLPVDVLVNAAVSGSAGGGIAVVRDRCGCDVT